MNYYEELGVNEFVTTDDIKHAYRQLAKKYHPDKNPNNEQAAKRFVRIATAYETLIDEKKRNAYDASLFKSNQKKKNIQKKATSSPTHVNSRSANDFENFFGFTTDGDKINPINKQTTSKTNSIDSSEMFEKFFGKAGVRK